VLVADAKSDSVFASLKGLNRLALAVSGGSDSMAMLRMVLAWVPNDVQVFVLTVDHGLRDGAAAEALQVAQWCAELGVSHQILKWDHVGVASGIQAKARVARYDLMAAWCVAQHVDVLLTAHTADDQAETVAMRQARTDSLKSLAGIWPERDWNGVRVLRPLLKMRRQDLRTFLRTVGQAWIEDPSNGDQRFERVRVRALLAGGLNGLDAQADQAQELCLEEARRADEWCSSNLHIHITGHVSVERASLLHLTAESLDLVILKLLALTGDANHIAERAERGRLQEWLRAENLGRRTLGGAIFAKRRDAVLVGREAGRIAPAECPASGQWDGGRFQIEGPAGSLVIPVGRLTGIPRRKDLPAFVQSGLPAVVFNNELWSIPHLGIGQEVFVKFLRH
jgi:tRNA(Ile)-lysidine synthase